MIDWKSILPDQNQCKLVHVNAIIRHGTRAPSGKDLLKVSALVDRLKTQHHETLAHEHVKKAVTKWQSSFNKEKELLANGHIELEFLGRNYANLINYYKDADFEVDFRSTSADRCLDSAKSFRKEMVKYLRDGVTIEAERDIKVNDTLLRFFKNCRRYTEEVDENPNANKEFEKLLESKFAVDWLTAWHRRLNLPEGTVAFKELLALWKVLGIEMAAFRESPLESLLSIIDEDHKFLEFIDDVEEYWLKVYGYPINNEMSYPLLADLLAHFNKAISSGKPTALFSFAHAETLLPLFANLGFFKDELHLGLEHAHVHLHDRKYRSSNVIPFAANIAFLLVKKSYILKVHF